MHQLFANGGPARLREGFHREALFGEESFFRRHHDGRAVDEGNVAQPKGATGAGICLTIEKGLHRQGEKPALRQSLFVAQIVLSEEFAVFVFVGRGLK
jgi:hypothetical protein